MNGFQQVAAAIYLASGLGALLGLALPAIRLRHAAAWGLSLGVVIQAVALAQLGKAMRVERGHMGHRTVAPNIVGQVAVELVRLEQMEPTLR